MKYKDSNGNMQDVGMLVGGETLAVDKTLTISGRAADAKEVGDRLSDYLTRIIELENIVSELQAKLN